jgi:RND family efflux transporter MFP subunit
MILSRFQARVVIGVVWAGAILLNVLILPGRYAPRVEIETLTIAPVPLITRASGNLDAKASETIKASFDGPVMQKHFQEGQRVRKGELLTVIGREHIRLDYQSKQNALSNAKADLARAQRNARLQKALFAKQAVAYSEVEDAQRALVLAKQTLESAQQGFKLEQLRWNSSSIVAPFDGTIVKDALGDDKQVLSGKDIVTVADISEFTVKVRVDELDIKRMEEGLPADVRIQIYPDKVFKAKISQVGSQPDNADSTLIPVTLRLTDNQGVLLRPKLTADVRILSGATSPTLSVPLTAIDNTDGTPKVWVLGTMNRLRERKVTLGNANPDRVEVTEGLRSGDRVCVTAEPDFIDGMKAAIGPSPLGTLSKTQQLMKKVAKDNPPPQYTPAKRGRGSHGGPR